MLFEQNKKLRKEDFNFFFSFKNIFSLLVWFSIHRIVVFSLALTQSVKQCLLLDEPRRCALRGSLHVCLWVCVSGGGGVCLFECEGEKRSDKQRSETDF